MRITDSFPYVFNEITKEMDYKTYKLFTFMVFDYIYYKKMPDENVNKELYRLLTAIKRNIDEELHRY